MVYACPRIYNGIQLEVCPKICLASKNIKKITVYQNSGRPCTLIHNLPRRTPCRLLIHELFLGPLGLHLLV